LMMAHLNRTAGNAATLSGNLAKVDVDGTMQNVNGALQDVRHMTGQLTNVMSDMQQKLNSKNNNLGAFLHDRALYDRLNQAVLNADSLLYDVRKAPKRYVHFSIFGRK
jgi:virulence factor mce family protein